jgi:hypothetical protein
MTGGPGFALHPLAAQDITEIWEYMAEDSPLRLAVSGRKYSMPSAASCHSLIRVIVGRT